MHLNIFPLGKTKMVLFFLANFCSIYDDSGTFQLFRAEKKQGKCGIDSWPFVCWYQIFKTYGGFFDFMTKVIEWKQSFHFFAQLITQNITVPLRLSYDNEIKLTLTRWAVRMTSTPSLKGEQEMDLSSANENEFFTIEESESSRYTRDDVITSTRDCPCSIFWQSES